MNIYCMRHGQTNYNLLSRCNSDPSKDVHLTDLGIRQAQAAAEQFEDIPLERIFVSELPRTRQTAEIVNRKHGLLIETQPALNDINSGCEGEGVAVYKQAVAANPLRLKVGNGESLLEHKERVVGFIQWLRHLPLSNVLIVAHEETLRVFAGFYRQLTDEEMIRLHFDNCQVLCFPLDSEDHS